ncbi:MAG: hypothetical protein ACYCXG_09090 [Acidiferrobacter sp.]
MAMLSNVTDLGLGVRSVPIPEKQGRIRLCSATLGAVIAHMLMSGVTERTGVLREVARVICSGSIAALCDGDYAALTYACSNHAFGRQMDDVLADTTFNNPRIMRDSPYSLREFGSRLTAVWGDTVVEIGNGAAISSRLRRRTRHLW